MWLKSLVSHRSNRGSNRSYQVAQITAIFPVLTISDSFADDLEGVIKDPTCLDNSTDYAFLNDPDTIEFIKNGRVMLIGRGLAGSGKSTIIKRIQEFYGPEKVAVCSGDDFFTDKNGVYKFRQDLLSQAHSSAQQKAQAACKSNISPVIIDNTNVVFWEVRPYLDIASQNNYVVVFVEPRTLFKFNVDRLFLSNKHKVPREVLVEKLKKFHVFVPYFFGFFLNRNCAINLISSAQTALKLCYDHLTQFRADFISMKNGEDPFQLFEFKKGELHCTTKYIGGKKNATLDENRHYYEHLHVAQSMGKAAKLQINGFCIGQSTISAIVSLKNASQKFLWKNNLTDKDKSSIQAEPFYQIRDIQSMFDKLEYGAHAHITLAMAHQVKAKQAVNDLINLKLRMMFAKQEKDVVKKIQADEMHELIYLNDLACFVRLKEPIIVDTIFTGHY